MKKNVFLTVFALILMLIIGACDRTPLCYTHPHTAKIKIQFDWRNSPSGIAPSSMSVYLFPEDNTSHAMRYEIVGCSGGEIEVPLGLYDIVCVNSDTQNITYTLSQTRDEFYLSTPVTSLLAPLNEMGVRAIGAPRYKGTESQRLSVEPDHIYTHRVVGVDCRVRDSYREVTMYPEPKVCEYTVTIENVPNLMYTQGVSAAITTLSDGLHFYHGRPSHTLATLPFPMNSDAQKSVLNGAFRTFGHPDSQHMEHVLSVYVVLGDGRKLAYDFDVTDQVHNAPDPYHVHIYLKDLPIPKPIVNGGGFHPEVSNWENEYIDLIM